MGRRPLEEIEVALRNIAEGVVEARLVFGQLPDGRREPGDDQEERDAQSDAAGQVGVGPTKVSSPDPVPARRGPRNRTAGGSEAVDRGSD